MPTIESMARPMAIPMAIPMAMIMLLAMLIAAPAHAADERWQVVRAEQTKVGHVRIVRSENGATIFDSEQLEIRLGRQGRRVLYRVRLDTESGSDGSLRRIARGRTGDGPFLAQDQAGGGLATRRMPEN